MYGRAHPRGNPRKSATDDDRNVAIHPPSRTSACCPATRAHMTSVRWHSCKSLSAIAAAASRNSCTQQQPRDKLIGSGFGARQPTLPVLTASLFCHATYRSQ